MTILDILNGAKALLEERFPGEKVYLNYAPVGFERPSSLVEGGPVVQTELGGEMTEFTVTLNVTLFEVVDDYAFTQIQALCDKMTAVMALFAGGYLRIGKRCPHVMNVKGEYEYDYARVTALLRFREPWPVGEEYPLMKNVVCEMKEE